MSNKNSVVAIYSNHSGAEAGVKELQASAFDMKKLSIVGRDYNKEEHVVGYYNIADRIKVWGKAGAFWGMLWGVLFGSAFFWVPGLGPLMVGGPLVVWIVGALESTAVVAGLSIVGASLFSLGIPKDSILRYETAIKADKFVLIVHGTEEDTLRAREILQKTEPETVDHH